MLHHQGTPEREREREGRKAAANSHVSLGFQAVQLQLGGEFDQREFPQHTYLTHRELLNGNQPGEQRNR